MRQTIHPSPKPPTFCDRGTMINQNLPESLGIGWNVDHTLPEGTIEVWQDGQLIGRIVNIGQPPHEALLEAAKHEPVNTLRAQLSKKDREIERLRAEQQEGIEFPLPMPGLECLWHEGEEVATLRSASAIIRWGRRGWELRAAFHAETESLRSQLSASQAREREAVADRESAIQKVRVFTRENEILHDSLLKIERAYKDTESALATSRKALHEYGSHKPGCRYGEPPRGFLDGGYPCTCGFRAAMAPEQKG